MAPEVTAGPATAGEAARGALRWLWTLLVSRGAPRAVSPAGAGRGAEASPGLADAPLDVLAAKVLFSHLRNRQQLLGPPPTAFGQLDAGQIELLMHAAIAAAYADGRIDEAEERQLRGALSSFGLQSDGRGVLDAAIKRPRPLESLLREVHDPHLASLFYAASLSAIDKHGEVNRAYLAYLAARLKLPEDVLTRLHSQFGFAADWDPDAAGPAVERPPDRIPAPDAPAPDRPGAGASAGTPAARHST